MSSNIFDDREKAVAYIKKTGATLNYEIVIFTGKDGKTKYSVHRKRRSKAKNRVAQ
jgi:hypothetical protein